MSFQVYSEMRAEWVASREGQIGEALTHPKDVGGGDKGFDSADDAARHFAENYYGQTQYSLHEIGTIIYEENGRYYYVKPIIGNL